MWGSLGVGNHTSIIDMGDELQTIIASTLVEHPLIKSNPNSAIRIAKDAITLDRDVSFVRPSFPKTGEGWFESQLGKTAE